MNDEQVSIASLITSKQKKDLGEASYLINGFDPSRFPILTDVVEKQADGLEQRMCEIKRAPAFLEALTKLGSLQPTTFTDSLYLNKFHICNEGTIDSLVLPEASEGDIVAFLWDGACGSEKILTVSSERMIDLKESVVLRIGDYTPFFYYYSGTWSLCRSSGESFFNKGPFRIGDTVVSYSQDLIRLYTKLKEDVHFDWPIEWPENFTIVSAIVSNDSFDSATMDGFTLKSTMADSARSVEIIALRKGKE